MADQDDLLRCSRCLARNLTEAAYQCIPSADQTGERSCPGVEWPLADLWDGTTTPEEVRAQLEAEDAACAPSGSTDKPET